MVRVRSSALRRAARREMLAGAVASYVWEHGAARGEALPGGARSVLTTAKKLPVALRRRGAALYWIAAVAPATRARPELASERPAARAANCGWGRPVGWGACSPSRADRNPRPRRSAPRAAGRRAVGHYVRSAGTGSVCGVKDRGSTAPVRTLALASFSLLTFLSLFLSSFLASLEPSCPCRLSWRVLGVLSSSLSLESFFSSFLTAFSSCVRRARDGARAARGAVDAKRAYHHAIAAIGASRRHRRRTFFFSFSLALAFSALSYSSIDFSA